MNNPIEFLQLNAGTVGYSLRNLRQIVFEYRLDFS